MRDIPPRASGEQLPWVQVKLHKVSLQFQKFIINATDDVFYLDLFYCPQCLLKFFSSFTRLLHEHH